MKTPILVSIIIPCYNASTTIERCLQSILDQTFFNYEVIIVDSKSNDGTTQIIDSFIERSKCREKFKHIVLDKAHSAAANRNYGISLSKGDYLSFLDADDYWLPEKLMEQVDYAEANGVDLLGCRTFSFNCWRHNEKKANYKTIRKKDIFLKNYFLTSTVLVKKSKLIHFNEDFVVFEDYLLWTTLVLKNNRAVVCSLKRVYYEQPNSSNHLSANLKRNHFWEIKYLKYFYNTKDINALRFAFYYILFKIKYIRRIFVSAIKRKK